MFDQNLNHTNEQKTFYTAENNIMNTIQLKLQGQKADLK